MDTLVVLKNYRPNPSHSHSKQLTELLEHFGLDEALPISDPGNEMVDIVELLELLPKEIEHGQNPAYRELSVYLQAIPPRRRVQGVHLRAETLLSLMLDRLEFFEGLSRSLVRTCKGRDCPHFSVCPFADVVENLTLEDRIPCAVERDVVRNAVESFVQPSDGSRPSVDPRRPEQALLFRQLVELLVKQTRLSMYMQQQDALIDHYEIIREGELETFSSMNQIEHPLLTAWDRNQQQILRVMKELGITPEFQIRQGLYIDEDLQIDADKRARELAANLVRDNLKKIAARLPEGDPSKQLLMEALASSEKQAVKKKTP